MKSGRLKLIPKVQFTVIFVKKNNNNNKKNQIIRKNKKCKQSNYKNGVDFLLEKASGCSEHSILLFLEGTMWKFLSNLSIDLGL